jgi:mono/diheme cytochrome c family protein
LSCIGIINNQLNGLVICQWPNTLRNLIEFNPIYMSIETVFNKRPFGALGKINDKNFLCSHRTLSAHSEIAAIALRFTPRNGPCADARATSHRCMRCFSIVAFAVFVGGCDLPTPLAPSEPIGTVPVWGTAFQQEAVQKPSLPGAEQLGAAGMPMAHAEAADVPKGPMPGAVADFSGGNADGGKAIYGALCASCHGAGGEGNAALRAPSFKDAAWQARTEDKQLARTIALGRGAMPSFMKDLDKQKMADVIAYVRTLSDK